MNRSRAYLFLGLATVACLLPFSRKAFHIDDPMFLWAAQQIAHHPLDPYGFHVVWYVSDMPMSEVMKNPPLSCYYAALVGTIAGWSERAMHIGFMLPAVALILGTYRLAQRFTASPLIAAVVTLVAPGFFVSATTIMCDVLMLSFWIWGASYWLDGLESRKALDFVVSGVLMAACALTHYFGICLVLLLFAYALLRTKRMGPWIWYLVIPVGALILYQIWTKQLYGHGLLLDAREYARLPQYADRTSRLTRAVVGLSFVGGCTLPVLFLAPLLRKWWQLLTAGVGGTLAGLSVGLRWLTPFIHSPEQHWGWVGVQFGIFVAGGILVFGLVLADYRKQHNADSALFALWILGTYVFAAFLNWTLSGRSVLPLIPPVAILLARQLDAIRSTESAASIRRFAVPVALTLSGVISFTVAWGDAAFADSGREMAGIIHRQTSTYPGTLLFQGHWGFQYYMQKLGATPIDYDRFALHSGDLMVSPENTTNRLPIMPQLVASQETLHADLHGWASTMASGAGFYSSIWGPLPFSIGRPRPEQYVIMVLREPDPTARK